MSGRNRQNERGKELDEKQRRAQILRQAQNDMGRRARNDRKKERNDRKEEAMSEKIYIATRL